MSDESPRPPGHARQAHERYGRSVVALKEVAPAEISSYGCAAADAVEGDIVRVSEIVEKPTPEEAPSNLAVMGRYVFTPEIFDALERVQPGKDGEIQLTDAISLLLEEQTVYGYSFEQGRYDIGNKLDYLRATVELALARDDLGPAFSEFLPRSSTGTDRSDPARRGPGRGAGGLPRACPRADAARRRPRLRHRRGRRVRPGRAALRQHRHGRLRRPQCRHRWRPRHAHGRRDDRRGHGPRHRRRPRRGRAHHDRRPHPAPAPTRW